MGFWDVIYSAGDRVAGITPDLSTAKRAAYDSTAAAVAKVDQAVRSVDSIPKLNEETKAQIGLFATTFAKHTGKYAVQEGYKLIPVYYMCTCSFVGATVATKLLSDVMLEVKQETDKDGTKAMQARIDSLEEDLKKSTSQQEISRQNSNLNPNGGGTENTKDMINMFMKTEFVGNHMFRDLMVPKLPCTEKKSIVA
ncbi:hypothetical protein OSB04_015448 [Centaurea solstitialis]|uniref:Uncharacterized protein n=1 Tax=Centaurea solstitialis TaxID=347529 RepID=A0AA38T6W3_9ASTR|nr:hypothetical protein OSB04_015448 [Centaurea solstitialis]